MKAQIICFLLMTGFSYAHWDFVDASASRADYPVGGPKVNGCVFCHELISENDAQCYILKRYTYVYVQLNLFPYRQAHMLVLPLRHVAKLQDLLPEERAELIEVVAQATGVLHDEYRVNGLNVGINEGIAGGASKPDHLHVHIVPRWHGDTGFFNIVGQVTIVSEKLADTYARLKRRFDALI